MERKTVIITALLLTLVLGNIQVQAKSCCPNAVARKSYQDCYYKLTYSAPRCASISGCKLLPVEICPNGWTYDILENTGDNAFNEYCKLGCASSVCGAITTLPNSDASEVVNGAIEKCTKACATFCTKGSITAVETS